MHQVMQSDDWTHTGPPCGGPAVAVLCAVLGGEFLLLSSTIFSKAYGLVLRALLSAVPNSV